MFKNQFALFLFLTLGLSSCQKYDSEVAKGKAYFEGFGCVKCHRVGNKGGVLGPDLSLAGFRKSPEWLDLWLKDPHNWKNNTLMPKFNVKDDVRRALVAYLSSLKGQDFDGAGRPWNAPDLNADPVKRGEVLFVRAGCIGCHAYNGAGGYPNNNVQGNQIPPLTFVADGYSKEELKARVRDGVEPEKADPAGPDPLIKMPKWGEILSDNELEAVVEYLYSLRPQTAKAEQW